MTRNLTAIALAATAALGLAACSSGSSDSPETGQLTLGLVDTPVLGIEHICILITQINVKPQDGSPISLPTDVTGSPVCARDGEQIDLLSLRDPDDPAVLLDAVALDAGRYDWIELVLDARVDGRGVSGNSYVIIEDMSEHDLRVPSGSIRLVSGFTITAGEHARFTLDWDARAGLSGVVNPPGLDGVLLRPAFRIIDMNAAAMLSGQVDGTLLNVAENGCAEDGDDLDVGNVVHIFEGTGVALADMNTTEPFATVDVENEAGIYTYETLLSPGGYTIAFTCQHELDDADLVFLLPDEGADLEVEDGDEAVRSFGIS